MSTIDERMKIICGVCGVNWEEHPENDTCWRHRPKPEPPPNGTPPEPPDDEIPGGVYAPKRPRRVIFSDAEEVRPLRSLQVERDGLLAQLAEIRAERDALKWTLQEANAEAFRLRVELAETTAELLEAREEIGRLTGENARLRTRMAL